MIYLGGFRHVQLLMGAEPPVLAMSDIEQSADKHDESSYKRQTATQQPIQHQLLLIVYNVTPYCESIG